MLHRRKRKRRSTSLCHAIKNKWGKIIMKHEKCCGAVVYTKIGDQIHYLLVQNLKGIYGFPKGHMEADETETETAIREIKEEVGLDVELYTSFRTTGSYMLPGM